MFGGSDGAPPKTQMVDMGSLVRDGTGGEKNGLTSDIRPTLPVVTHDRRCSGKMDHFGGMYCCLGGLMGAPPCSQMVHMGSLVRDGVSGEKKWLDLGF